jgi:hypothetical protein
MNEEEVEYVARAINGLPGFDDIAEYRKENYRHDARAAIKALDEYRWKKVDERLSQQTYSPPAECTTRLLQGLAEGPPYVEPSLNTSERRPRNAQGDYLCSCPLSGQ